MRRPSFSFAPALAAALAALLLGGCETVHYDYAPPATDQGRFCVTQCAAIQESCHGNEMARAQNAQSSCQRSEDVRYRECMKRTANAEQEKHCRESRKSCYEYEDTERCAENYRQCFSNCGGTVTKTITK